MRMDMSRGNIHFYNTKELGTGAKAITSGIMIYKAKNKNRQGLRENNHMGNMTRIQDFLSDRASSYGILIVNPN